ncbi:MAG TPA: hypothetical protein VG993_09535 [Actinomycetota bacterium]|jgi:hypothetical protein|nr:hypothetical protein [Actinomycetota bacterium]
MDASALDFWLGEWDCDWDGGRGTNSIVRELDDRVVVERFEALAPEPFTGMSVSVFDEGSGWRQTWVDSNSSYWHLVGSTLPDGSLVFGTPERVDAEHVYKRMVFWNVADDGFSWRWEASPDGERWQERWAIRYTRRP